ncbi:MAG: nitrate- and nitrite sensing domain-containing protein [Angustibacter sp.]
MLRDRGIRTKLLAVLALPVIVLMVGVTVLSVTTFKNASRAATVEQLARQGAVFGDLVDSLNAERATSIDLLSGEASRATLKRARAATDRNLAAVDQFYRTVDLASVSSRAAEVVAASQAAHAKLKAIRASLEKGGAQPDQVAQRYSEVIAIDAALPKRIGDSLEYREIGRQLAAYSAAVQLVDLAEQEYQLGARVIAAGDLSRPDAVTFTGLERAQLDAAQNFRNDASPAQQVLLERALEQPVEVRGQYARHQVDIASSSISVDVDPVRWRATATSRISDLSKVVPTITQDVAELAAEQAGADRRAAVLLLGGGLVVIVLLLLLGVLLARAVVQPLRHLTKTATDVATELPKMVERMAEPGQAPAVMLPDIEVRSADEVGQLADAFRHVNETTLRVAEEQAALRASIAEMFVNVARRNHVLLSRQLSFIDQLERTEEDPDTLENLFRLDHLATRMRRNAESLIVLAGIDAGRRLRRPMPLSDVVRTAVSEIERYDRVDLALQADPPLVGHIALTAAHLVAELLENATQFSNPDTRVVVATSLVPTGVQITVTDQGLGMTWDEITEANERIAHPPTTDVVGSQRLGFYVVGRLARRLDATVELQPGRNQGTVVAIVLPPALFVPGSVTDLPAADLDIDAAIGTDVGVGIGGSPAQPWPGTDAGGAGASADSPLGDTGTPVRMPPVFDPPSAKSPLLESSTDSPTPTTTNGLPRRSASAGASPQALSSLIPSQSSVLPAGPGHDQSELDHTGPAASPTAGQRRGIFSGFRSRRVVDESDEASEAPSAQSAKIEAAPAELAATEAALTEALSVEAPPAESLTEGSTEPPLADPVLTELFEAEQLVTQTEATSSETTSFETTSFETTSYDTTTLETTTYDTTGSPSLVDDVVPETAEDETSAERVVPAWAEHAAALSPLDDDWTPEFLSPSSEESAEADSSTSPALDLPAAQGSVAYEPTVEPTDEQDGAAAHPVEPAAPQLPPIGLPAMDVLPSRGAARGIWRRKSTPRGLAPATPSAGLAPVLSPSATPAAPAAAVPAHELLATDRSISEGGQLAPAGEPLAVHLPTRQSSPPPAPFATGISAAATLRQRSAMASEALSELSALSTYSPESVGATASSTLRRRTPGATPAGRLATTPEEPIGARRGTRNAADVRSMLSGFQAGVQRGRTGDQAASASHDPAHEESLGYAATPATGDGDPR